MRLNWKNLRLAAFAVLVVGVTGCSGISASKSISPASFLLPGLLKADPPPTHPERDLPAQEPAVQVAQS